MDDIVLYKPTFKINNLVDSLMSKAKVRAPGHNTYNYSFEFTYEKVWQNTAMLRRELIWFYEGWYLPLLYSITYICLVFLGQRIMKNREKFRLNRSLIAWNILLACFSILGTIRALPAFLARVFKYGLDYSICDNSMEFGALEFWTFAFVMTKLVDMFDTAFVILRKQKLIFLHWYHHSITLILTWFLYRRFSSIGRWFVVMNLTVHSFMYSYYAFKAARFSIPKAVNLFITTLQIVQMIAGVWLNVYALVKKLNGGSCDTPLEGLYFALSIYFSFFVLFTNFFVKAYLKKENSAVKLCAGVELNSKFLLKDFSSNKTDSKKD
jgi:elongation of very long chain fatty acids protein 6